MDNPLYFVSSEYSLSSAVDTAQIAGRAHALYLAWETYSRRQPILSSD
jgi:hypothetical protein